MALVTWDESYSVKVQKCDEDHRRLFSMINTLHDAMITGKGSEVIRKVVKELSDYAKFHFSREEAMLEKTNYPELAAHRAKHREFVGKVEEFQRNVEQGATGQSISVLNFLNNWLTHHIKETDKKYSAHVNKAGVN